MSTLTLLNDELWHKLLELLRYQPGIYIGKEVRAIVLPQKSSINHDAAFLCGVRRDCLGCVVIQNLGRETTQSGVEPIYISTMRTLSSEQVTQIRQLTNAQDNFDGLVAFGYGPVQRGSSPGSYRLNLYGRINAIATGMLYQSLNIGRIILTGGKTGGADKPSEAALMSHLIQTKFGIPDSMFILEEEAMDTIFNIIYIINIIEQSPHLYQNLLFVALSCHLPRIREICALIRLRGCFVAAESVVELLSKRHKHLLLKLLHPENDSYASMLESQERGMRGIGQMPEYWLPPLGTLKNTQRLRAILATPKVQSFLNHYPFDILALPAEQLHKTISEIPRQFPN